MGEDLNFSKRIFKHETPYTRIFEHKNPYMCGLIFRRKNWYTYQRIFLKNLYMYGLTFRRKNWYMYRRIFTDFSQKSVHVRITYIWEYLWMFARLPTNATIICNFGAEHSFDAMAKYRHWQERADVTCYTLMLCCYLSTLIRDGVTLHVCTELYSQVIFQLDKFCTESFLL